MQCSTSAAQRNTLRQPLHGGGITAPCIARASPGRVMVARRRAGKFFLFPRYVDERAGTGQHGVLRGEGTRGGAGRRGDELSVLAAARVVRARCERVYHG